jgi:hypothetical protein
VRDRVAFNHKIAILVLGNSVWRMVQKHLDRMVVAVNEAMPGS